MVQVVCGVSNNGCIASNGDLDAVAEVTHDPRGLSDVSSCNATNSIEHLDWQPPCDARWGHENGAPPAEVIAIVQSCPCVSGHRLWCRQCLEFTLARDIWFCSTCSSVFHGQPVKSWEPLR